MYNNEEHDDFSHVLAKTKKQGDNDNYFNSKETKMMMLIIMIS